MTRRIAFVAVNDYTPWGGSEILWSRTADRFLDREGWEVGVGVRGWSPLPEPVLRLQTRGARLFLRDPHLRWRPRAIPARALHGLFTLLYPFVRYRILTAWRPDLVVISLGDHNDGADWMNACRRLGIPYVLLVQLVKEGHCPPDDTEPYHDLKRGYQAARRVYVVSRDNLDLLTLQFAIEPTNFEIVSNPFRRPERPIAFPAEAGVTNLAMVASLNLNHKGHDVILKLLRDPKWRERGLRVNFYGNGPHARLLPELARRWQVDDLVRFHGFVDDLDRIWSENQALLLPSRMEGLSLALLESTMYERMAISTRVGDAGRLVEDGSSGFLVDAATVEALDRALERAWAARGEWEAMGRRARARAESLLPPDPVGDFADRLTALLETPGS